VSRHPIFGNLNLTLSLVIIWTLIFVMLWLGARGVRQAAIRARSRSLARLRLRRWQALQAGGEAGDKRASLLDLAASEIKQESRGAFQHWLQDPFLNAVAVLFGGAGGLQIIGHLLQYR
jgi:hypothetical protein